MFLSLPTTFTHLHGARTLGPHAQPRIVTPFPPVPTPSTAPRPSEWRFGPTLWVGALGLMLVLPAAAQTAVRRFYQRYNKAALDQCVLQHRRHKLQQENARLKLMLQQYFDGFSVSAEVLEAPNSLLIVNNRSNVRYVCVFVMYFI